MTMSIPPPKFQVGEEVIPHNSEGQVLSENPVAIAEVFPWRSEDDCYFYQLEGASGGLEEWKLRRPGEPWKDYDGHQEQSKPEQSSSAAAGDNHRINPHLKYTPQEFANLDPDIAEAFRKYYEKQLDPSNSRIETDNEEPDRKTHRYVVRDAAYALQPQPPVDWVVDRLFSAGSVSLLVGAPGSMKTYIMLSAAVCAALGRGWLQDFQTKQCSALIIDEESGDRRMARRLGEVLRGEFGDEKTPIKYVSLAQFNLQDAADALLLQALIEDTGAEFVIIDALADIMPGADENAVKDVQPVFMRLRKMAEETKAAIVLIHHSNKAGDYRGSSAMSGAVDLLLMVESKDNDPHINFITKKARDIEPFKFSAMAHFNDGQVWFTASDSKEKKRKWGNGHRYVLRYLAENGESSLTAIKSAADICSEGTAKNALYKLTELGHTIRTNPGESGQGVEALYNLTDLGKLEAKKLGFLDDSNDEDAQD